MTISGSGMSEPKSHDADAAIARTWPDLPYAGWSGTCEALHRWTQIVGKVRLAQTLSTGPVPHGARSFDMEFDFTDHLLRLRTERDIMTIPLIAQPVADFYRRVMEGLAALQVPVSIVAVPNELPDATPFSEDTVLRPYDREQAARFWRVLAQADRALKTFRTGFLGKASPVHFFWGSFDLAVTRFSGRRAPLHPGGVPHLPDRVAREAYSHQVSSAGFWPGGPDGQDVAFYSYAYPEPEDFRGTRVAPEAAFFDERLGEFLLPYAALRVLPDPESALMAFLQSTYAAAANAAKWDRAALECSLGVPGRPRDI
jgi:hypothetical protein